MESSVLGIELGRITSTCSTAQGKVRNQLAERWRDRSLAVCRYPFYRVKIILQFPLPSVHHGWVEPDNGPPVRKSSDPPLMAACATLVCCENPRPKDVVMNGWLCLP